ncbi:Predicted membrane protein [Verrucomicrobium sp. GAS474]|uniref:DUF2231 domain-containing protein n=1 Tax=Verrucomicrobium sp. GAS474 TaxID=1882831 RepID=UPI00087B5F0F|nr:DUF2231 domain-containing protein [Verrucomicrobium sp. GAS474]SDT91127.1 Predicted membrane protein [Verrucomicrobium sp. GAS474]
MHLDPLLWPKLHGASAHFPIALTLVAAVCEGVALRLAEGPRREGLRATGFYCIVAAALGTVPAVLSGLVMTHGETMGHDLLRWHHLFVWPSFALIVGLAVWRFKGETGERLYIAVLMAAAVLISLAGYWGGEMIVNG